VILPAAAGLVVLVTILLLATRGSGTTPPPRAASAPPQPDTAAAAQVAAERVFQLYSAGQYGAVYAYLVPAVRSAVAQATWVAVHRQCRIATGPAYTVDSLALTGQTAVVTLALGPVSQTQVFDYVAGKWLWVPSGQDIAAYTGSVAKIVKQLKSDGYCSS
jgi:hypothetical protein